MALASEMTSFPSNYLLHLTIEFLDILTHMVKERCTAFTEASSEGMSSNFSKPDSPPEIHREVSKKCAKIYMTKKGKNYVFLKKGQATQDNYKDIVKFCRKKIRRAKAHLELNLATAIKDNKKAFYQHISNRNVEKNLHPFLDDGGKQSQRMKKTLRYLMPSFFTSVFSSNISCCLCTSPLSWKTGMRSRMKPP